MTGFQYTDLDDAWETVRYVYLMHYSRARSLKRDGRDHSLSMKQAAVVPSTTECDPDRPATMISLCYIVH